MDELLGTRELFQLAEADSSFRERYDVDTWRTVAEGSYSVVGQMFCLDHGFIVAVKLIRFRILPAAREKIRAEVANARAVKSDYVLKAWSPYFRGDLAWIEMPYVPGATLDDELGQRRFTFDEARSLSLNLLDALRAAHAVDVVHRDIKPANLLIPSDPPLRLLVLDFGISRAGDAARMTATGFPGTPEYASPEAWSGRPVGAPGDVYSATSVLYQLFAGQRPWPVGKDLSPEQICQLTMRRLGPPRRLREIAAELPVSLDNILYDGISLEPERRPTAAELYRQIEDLGNGSAHNAEAAVAIGEALPPPPTTPVRPTSRRGLWIGAAAVALFVAVLAGVFFLLASRSPVQVHAQAVLPRLSLHATADGLDVANITDRDVSSLRLDVEDALGQKHNLTIDTLAAGKTTRLDPARWTPPLGQPLPQSVAARATVAGVVEEATLVVATPTPIPEPTASPLPKGLTARGDETRSLEITNGTGHKLEGLRLSIIDAKGAIHDVDEGELELGMSTMIWAGKWTPPLTVALPKDVLVTAKIDGHAVHGTLSIASP